MIKIGDKEIENVYFNGTKLDHVYVNGVMVYESTIYVAKPTVSGAYTFDTVEHSAVINGVNEDAMTVEGTTKATSSGTYTVTFKLKKGYAWDDETTSELKLTWNIAKRTIGVPSLSATWFAWVEGAGHSVIVSGIDTKYVNQSGDLAQSDNSGNIGAKHTVSWGLKYPSDTVWTDGKNEGKSSTWGVYWQNGTSHYSNDLYNAGWNSGKLEAMNGKFQSDCFYYDGSNASAFDNLSSGYIIKEKDNTADVRGRTFHAIVSSNKTIGIGTIAWNNSSWSYTGMKTGAAQASAGENKEIYLLVTTTNKIDRVYAIMVSSASGAWAKIHRVWVT